jgi:transcriptional regulator with XRE-family HTH domain
MGIQLSINERIVKLIKKLSNGNQKEFAKEVGVAATTISNIVGQRKSHPSYTLLNKIVTRYPEVNATWLLTGKGKPLSNT